MGTAKSTSAFTDVTDRMSDVRSNVEKTAREAASKLTDNLSMVGDRVQDRPLLALGIALGAGFLIGRLMAR